MLNAEVTDWCRLCAPNGREGEREWDKKRLGDGWERCRTGNSEIECVVETAVQEDLKGAMHISKRRD